MDEQMQLQIVLLVQASMQGDQLATQLIQLIMQAALQGDQLAALIALLIQQVALLMQSGEGGQPQMARMGAKLEYIKYLRGQCPNGYEMKYFKAGGKVCKKCMKKAAGGNIPEPEDPVSAYKCGRKMMKKKENGGTLKQTPKQPNKTGKPLKRKYSPINEEEIPL